ncbi:hypothetical protein K2Z84_31660 [Candidatus Binatia bacterium]|jgi:hypothetical protein|nr:hypothetical protein [Candidatus Binatia bacterium]
MRHAPHWLVTFALVVAFAGQASAEDVCLTDGASHYAFKSVKALKPGMAIPLHGYVVFPNAFDVYPLTGTAMMETDRTVLATVVAVELGGPGASVLFGWKGDAVLVGGGVFDKLPFDGIDGAVTLSPVGCKSVVLP